MVMKFNNLLEDGFLRGICLGMVISMIIMLLMTGCSDYMLMADYEEINFEQLGSSPYNPMYVKVVD